jgi:hypothetical protein
VTEVSFHNCYINQIVSESMHSSQIEVTDLQECCIRVKRGGLTLRIGLKKKELSLVQCVRTLIPSLLGSIN